MERLIANLLRQIQCVFGDNLVSVVLYGSTARGEVTPTSDIDLLIICETLPEKRRERHNLLDEVQKGVGGDVRRLYQQGKCVQIMPIVKTREEAEYHSPLYLDMVEDAKLLYDRDGFFAGVLEDVRQKLQANRARRVYLKGGGWYWDLKPGARFGERIEI